MTYKELIIITNIWLVGLYISGNPQCLIFAIAHLVLALANFCYEKRMREEGK